MKHLLFIAAYLILFYFWLKYMLNNALEVDEIEKDTQNLYVNKKGELTKINENEEKI